MEVAALVFRAILEPSDKPDQLFGRLVTHAAAFLLGGQFRITENSGIAIAAGPGNDRRRARRKEIDPIEGALLGIEADDAALDLGALQGA